MANYPYDVAILGGGPGGYVVLLNVQVETTVSEVAVHAGVNKFPL